MKSDKKGCSQCPKGQENHEEFNFNGRDFVQYDYRHIDGKLFSCVAKSLDDARSSRDKWLKSHTN